MVRLNLRQTHKLVFRQVLATFIFSVLIGLGLMIAPGLFFSSENYQKIIGVVAAPHLWGALWLVCAALISIGMARVSYKFTQAGLMVFSVICMFWSVGLLLVPIVAASSAYTAAAIWGLISVRTFALALEPPINPATAIPAPKGEEND